MPVRPELLDAVGMQETGGESDPDKAVSVKGARGRYQIMSPTARAFGFDPAKLGDRTYSRNAADTILGKYIEQARGDEREGLKSYYGRGKPPPGHPTADEYADRVLARAGSPARKPMAATDEPTEVGPNSISAIVKGGPYNEPPIPEEVGPQILSGLIRGVPRAVGQATGAEAGGAIGTALGGPPGGILGAAIGGGIANVAGKYLPHELGGDPSESTLWSFGWGAVPEGAARGIAQSIETRALKRGAGAAHEAIIQGLSKGPMPAEAAGQVASALGRTSLARPPVLTGNVLTDSTNALRKDILDPITAMRRKLGEPIGEAYKGLKEGNAKLTEEEANDLQGATQNVRDDLIAPYPQAKSTFNKIKKWQPPPTPQELADPSSAFQRTEGGDYIVKRSLTSNDVNWLKMNNFSDSQIQRLLAASKAYEPPTRDELREVRQVVNEKLRSAKGGDVHALAGLQQAIDEKLMPYLPDTIGRDRQLYRGFIQRFPWRDINKLNQMGTPRELGNWVFSGTPERVAEIAESAGPQGRQALAEALKDHALNAVNPDAPLDEQVKQVQKVLGPYIADGTAARIFGTQGADDLREVFYAPVHREQMAKILAQPEQERAFKDEWVRAARSAGPKQLSEAEAGLTKLIQSLPPQERVRFMQAAVPGAKLPVLPRTGESLKAGLAPGESKLSQRMMNRATFSGPFAVGRAATGNPAYAISNLLGMAGVATTAAGYRAFMENGGASALSRIYASPNGRVLMRRMIEGLAAIGAQGGQQATSE